MNVFGENTFGGTDNRRLLKVGFLAPKYTSDEVTCVNHQISPPQQHGTSLTATTAPSWELPRTFDLTARKPKIRDTSQDTVILIMSFLHSPESDATRCNRVVAVCKRWTLQ